MLKTYITLFLVFCLIGAGLEWSYGAFWDVVGVTPWTYPKSGLHYTSLEGLPLWGFGGLICVSINEAVKRINIKSLSGAIICFLLSGLWILFYSHVFQS